MGKGRSVLYLHLVCPTGDHLSVSRLFGQAGGMGPHQGADSKRSDRGQTSLVRVKGQDQDSDVSCLQEGAQARWREADVFDGLRWVQPEPDARLLGIDRSMGRDGRR